MSEQLLLFLRSVLLGGVLGLVYDLLRPLRRLGGRLWGGLLDALYGLTAVSALFFFVMAGDGELRVFILLGALGGAVLIFCLLSRPMRPLWEFWAAIFLKPVGWAKKFGVECEKNRKKLFSFGKKWFTILFTPKTGAERKPPRRGEDERAGDTRKTAAKPAKTRPGSRLTAIILLALFLGIGVQFLNMYARLQEAQEESAPPEENALRARRLSFYERSGFRRLDYQTRIFGVQYAMLVWPEEDAAEPERLQDAHRGLYRGQLPNPLFRRVIHIPADEH